MVYPFHSIFPFSIQGHMLLQNQYLDVVHLCTKLYCRKKRVKVEKNINDTVLLFYAKDGN